MRRENHDKGADPARTFAASVRGSRRRYGMRIPRRGLEAIRRRMKRALLLLSFPVLLAACAGYSGRGLAPGVATEDDVVRTMGTPALRWENPDRSSQLAYPRGPMGFHTFMAYLDAAGRLERIEEVLNFETFARVQPGMGQEEVLRLLGPPAPGETVLYRARRELDWGWRYCDAWNAAAHFYVLFDQDSGLVRSTMSVRENCGEGDCPCNR